MAAPASKLSAFRASDIAPLRMLASSLAAVRACTYELAARLRTSVASVESPARLYALRVPFSPAPAFL